MSGATRSLAAELRPVGPEQARRVLALWRQVTSLGSTQPQRRGGTEQREENAKTQGR